ncbi:nucleoside triphosphate pyrophosphohydrolase [Candidatus Sumerlaeota bacterium]|nr:nucleoside triphosphate pyrophosphohydrolase [Candidatus Sumerlaeota bacterium]
MRTLLGPGGCPWDREQTPETLKPHLIEEIYEACDSIDRGDHEGLREELGDVLMHVVFLSLLAEQSGHFALPEVIDGICDKLIRRHPHVFGDEERIEEADAVVDRWEAIKAQEREEKSEKASRLDGVPHALPALLRAHRIQEKAAKAGFDWDDVADVRAKIHEEIDEFEREAAAGDPERMEDEFGDLLFAIVNLGRWRRINSESALQRTNLKFTRRFRQIEAWARREGRSLESMTLAEMDAIWEETKSEE